MNTVGNSFQLGCLVDHIFGGCNLAAVMQPSRNMQFVPLVRSEIEIFIDAFGAFGGRLSQHFRELRHALAMPTSVGRFGVDGGRD